MHKYFEKSINRVSTESNTCYKDVDGVVRKKMLNEYEHQAFHTSDICPINNKPIEKIVHYVWLSNHKQNEKSKEISENNFQALLKQKTQLEKNDVLFKRICWINDEELIPDSIKKLMDLGIEVRNINSLKEEIPNVDKVNELLEAGIYGVAIDYIKYQVLRIFGGIDLDLNYDITVDNLADYLNAFSFFAAPTPNGRKVGYENAMIAAHQGHNIPEKVCSEISEQLNYISSSFDNNKGITDNYFIIFGNIVHSNLNPYADGAPEEVCSQSSFIGSDTHENSWVNIAI
jgi:hypothetical protein